MIKLIKKFQVKLTPFDATKTWNMSNINNQDLLLIDSGSYTEEIPVALEFIDYGGFGDIPTDNYECNIALEQQDDDLVNTRIGLKTSGLFFPNLDPVNIDGTYKRVVYSQVNTMFYNNTKDPTKTWGINNIDFILSKTKRHISDEFRLFDVPQDIYGDKIVPKSVLLHDYSLDVEFNITDDGNGNLLAGPNLFSKCQEIGDCPNTFVAGYDYNCSCPRLEAVPTLFVSIPDEYTTTTSTTTPSTTTTTSTTTPTTTTTTTTTPSTTTTTTTPSTTTTTTPSTTTTTTTTPSTTTSTTSTTTTPSTTTTTSTTTESTTTTTTPSTTTTTTTPSTTTTTTPSTTTTTTTPSTTTTTTTPSTTTTTTPSTTTTTTTTTPSTTTTTTPSTTTTTTTPSTTTTTTTPSTTTTTTTSSTTTTTPSTTTTTTTSTTTLPPECTDCSALSTDPIATVHCISDAVGPDGSCTKNPGYSDFCIEGASSCNYNGVCLSLKSMIVNDELCVLPDVYAQCWAPIVANLELCGWGFTDTPIFAPNAPCDIWSDTVGIGACNEFRKVVCNQVGT